MKDLNSQTRVTCVALIFAKGRLSHSVSLQEVQNGCDLSPLEGASLTDARDLFVSVIGVLAACCQRVIEDELRTAVPLLDLIHSAIKETSRM